MPDKKILVCNNCNIEIAPNDFNKEKSWHACWKDQRDGICKITGYAQEGTFFIKK